MSIKDFENSLEMTDESLSFYSELGCDEIDPNDPAFAGNFNYSTEEAHALEAWAEQAGKQDEYASYGSVEESKEMVFRKKYQHNAALCSKIKEQVLSNYKGTPYFKVFSELFFALEKYNELKDTKDKGSFVSPVYGFFKLGFVPVSITEINGKVILVGLNEIVDKANPKDKNSPYVRKKDKGFVMGPETGPDGKTRWQPMLPNQGLYWTGHASYHKRLFAIPFEYILDVASFEALDRINFTQGNPNRIEEYKLEYQFASMNHVLKGDEKYYLPTHFGDAFIVESRDKMNAAWRYTQVTFKKLLFLFSSANRSIEARKIIHQLVDSPYLFVDIKKGSPWALNAQQGWTVVNSQLNKRFPLNPEVGLKGFYTNDIGEETVFTLIDRNKYGQIIGIKTIDKTAKKSNVRYHKLSSHQKRKKNGNPYPEIKDMTAFVLDEPVGFKAPSNEDLLNCRFYGDDSKSWVQNLFPIGTIYNVIDEKDGKVLPSLVQMTGTSRIIGGNASIKGVVKPLLKNGDYFVPHFVDDEKNAEELRGKPLPHDSLIMANTSWKSKLDGLLFQYLKQLRNRCFSNGKFIESNVKQLVKIFRDESVKDHLATISDFFVFTKEHHMDVAEKIIESNRVFIEIDGTIFPAYRVTVDVTLTNLFSFQGYRFQKENIESSDFIPEKDETVDDMLEKSSFYGYSLRMVKKVVDYRNSKGFWPKSELSPLYKTFALFKQGKIVVQRNTSDFKKNSFNYVRRDLADIGKEDLFLGFIKSVIAGTYGPLNSSSKRTVGSSINLLAMDYITGIAGSEEYRAIHSNLVNDKHHRDVVHINENELQELLEYFFPDELVKSYYDNGKIPANATLPNSLVYTLKDGVVVNAREVNEFYLYGSKDSKWRGLIGENVDYIVILNGKEFYIPAGDPLKTYVRGDFGSQGQSASGNLLDSEYIVFSDIARLFHYLLIAWRSKKYADFNLNQINHYADISSVLGRHVDEFPIIGKPGQVLAPITFEFDDLSEDYQTFYKGINTGEGHILTTDKWWFEKMSKLGLTKFDKNWVEYIPVLVNKSPTIHKAAIWPTRIYLDRLVTDRNEFLAFMLRNVGHINAFEVMFRKDDGDGDLASFYVVSFFEGDNYVRFTPNLNKLSTAYYMDYIKGECEYKLAFGGLKDLTDKDRFFAESNMEIEEEKRNVGIGTNQIRLLFELVEIVSTRTEYDYKKAIDLLELYPISFQSQIMDGLKHTGGSDKWFFDYKISHLFFEGDHLCSFFVSDKDKEEFLSNFIYVIRDNYGSKSLIEYEELFKSHEHNLRVGTIYKSRLFFIRHLFEDIKLVSNFDEKSANQAFCCLFDSVMSLFDEWDKLNQRNEYVNYDADGNPVSCFQPLYQRGGFCDVSETFYPSSFEGALKLFHSFTSSFNTLVLDAKRPSKSYYDRYLRDHVWYGHPQTWKQAFDVLFSYCKAKEEFSFDFNGETIGYTVKDSMQLNEFVSDLINNDFGTFMDKWFNDEHLFNILSRANQIVLSNFVDFSKRNWKYIDKSAEQLIVGSNEWFLTLAETLRDGVARYNNYKMMVKYKKYDQSRDVKISFSLFKEKFFLEENEIVNSWRFENGNLVYGYNRKQDEKTTIELVLDTYVKNAFDNRDWKDPDLVEDYSDVFDVFNMIKDETETQTEVDTQIESEIQAKSDDTQTESNTQAEFDQQDNSSDVDQAVEKFDHFRKKVLDGESFDLDGNKIENVVEILYPKEGGKMTCYFNKRSAKKVLKRNCGNNPKAQIASIGHDKFYVVEVASSDGDKTDNVDDFDWSKCPF